MQALKGWFVLLRAFLPDRYGWLDLLRLSSVWVLWISLPNNPVDALDWLAGGAIGFLYFTNCDQQELSKLRKRNKERYGN
jgi:hypothetical protein